MAMMIITVYLHQSMKKGTQTPYLRLYINPIRLLTTHLRYLLPEASLKRIFTLDAVEKAKSEKYHHKIQILITQDNELDREIQDDVDNDPMMFLKLDDELDNPFQIDEIINLVGGNSIWNFQGDDETINTAAGSSTCGISFNSIWNFQGDNETINTAAGSSTCGISFNSAHIRYYSLRSVG